MILYILRFWRQYAARIIRRICVNATWLVVTPRVTKIRFRDTFVRNNINWIVSVFKRCLRLNARSKDERIIIYINVFSRPYIKYWLIELSRLRVSRLLLYWHYIYPIFVLILYQLFNQFSVQLQLSILWTLSHFLFIYFMIYCLIN